MTFPEARKILGLGPDEDPRPHIEEFKAARERIAEMVRGAPNDTLGMRYQQGLMEFDQAMAAVHEHLEALGLAPKRERITAEAPEPPPVPAVPAAPPSEDCPAEETPAVEIPERRSRAGAIFLWFLVFLIGGAGGALLYVKNEEQKELRRDARIAFLEREGAIFIENRRWQEADRSFSEIERLDPGSEVARTGRRSIEAGIAEEQKQFIGYWTGQAIAELDAGRVDEAETAIREVTARFPDDPEAAAIIVRIQNAKALLSRDRQVEETREAMREGDWEKAIGLARGLISLNAADADGMNLLQEAEAGLARQAANRERAASLFARAKQRDAGKFDAQALEWLREAVSLDPGNAEVRSLFETMSSYTRVIRVPGDFDTPAEALATARDKDRIVLAEGTWKGPLVLTAAVALEGAGPDKTILECPPEDGSALTIAPTCLGANVSGIAIRHESIRLTGDDRFSAALVRGGGVTFTDCHFLEASGHGLAVIEKGEAVVQRCVFRGNGWNGAAVIGAGTALEAGDSDSSENFENGFEAWDGASLTLLRSRCTDNSRNGVHVDARSSKAVLRNNRFLTNREFGVVITGAGAGSVGQNTARGNLLGGMVVRRGAAGLAISQNECTGNSGPGLVLENGLEQTSYADNRVSGNKGGEIVAGVDLGSTGENGSSPDR